MNRIKYLIIFCVIILLIGSSARSLSIQNKNNMNRQAQRNTFESVVRNTKSEVVIDKNILIDDNEKPILISPVVKKVVNKPYISAESYLVANLETGQKYIEFNTSKVFPIASVSKLYTALVVHHLFDLEKPIVITQEILDTYGDAGHLVLDEKLLPNELLGALLLESSNDAAEAFARSFGYAEFMEQMNGFAQEIGMSNTYFSDSSGLSPLNVSNAKDLFVLSKYLYTSEEDILAISRTKNIEIATTTEHGSHSFININPFVDEPEFLGGKTGRTTQAKEAMVSIFKKNIGNTEYPIAVIVLRSDLGQREIDTKKLLKKFSDLF